jgi:bacteriocin-like protein
MTKNTGNFEIITTKSLEHVTGGCGPGGGGPGGAGGAKRKPGGMGGEQQQEQGPG